ncbi:MAG: glycosyltransferase [Anaerolineaceae bacterium]
MSVKKKILILTADAGFGHRSAANAVAAAIEEKYPNELIYEIVNPLDNKGTPTFLRESQADYTKWVRNVPELYRFGYDASDALVPTRLLENSLSVLLHDVMRDILKESQPDAILATYPMYPPALTPLFHNKKRRVPLFTSITDLSTVHRLWFHRKVDGCLVPNSLVADLATSYGLNPEKVIITGIAVNPNVVRETRSKTEIRAELGWTPDIPTVLAVGSKRVERLIDTLNIINHFGAPLQLVVVAGKDEHLLSELSHFDWHIPAHIYDFVDNVPLLMHASDLIISKAGGLIVTESLACGLPMILIEILPGQETGNAEYVTALGAADLADDPICILENLSHLLQNNHSLLKQRAENAARIGQPRSAYKIADILFNAVKDSPPHKMPVSKKSKHNTESEINREISNSAVWMP